MLKKFCNCDVLQVKKHFQFHQPATQMTPLSKTIQLYNIYLPIFPWRPENTWVRVLAWDAKYGIYKLLNFNTLELALEGMEEIFYHLSTPRPYHTFLMLCCMGPTNCISLKRINFENYMCGLRVGLNCYIRNSAHLRSPNILKLYRHSGKTLLKI